MATNVDLLIIGGGIVGIATARELQKRHPTASIRLIEKETQLAQHQTGRNSGVIHAGVYYAPGSLKARFCREGLTSTKAFCDEHKLTYHNCGKLIVATNEDELERMLTLYERASNNGIDISPVSQEDLNRLEPNIQGIGALLSPSTAITDYRKIAETMAAEFQAKGGEIQCGVTVTGGTETDQHISVMTNQGEIIADKVVSCAGLMSDRLARAFGAEPDYKIIPFRGEYFRIQNQAHDLVNHLIYPVPDPEQPFLGVHLTRKMDGGFTVGPNAVLAFKREGYNKTDFSIKDMAETIGYAGFWKVIAKNLGSAVDELAASTFRSLYIRKVQKYCSLIDKQDLSPYPPGIRAQAVTKDGKLVDDFLFLQTPRSLHVCNAPSPAATASIPIAAYIADRLEGKEASTPTDDKTPNTTEDKETAKVPFESTVKTDTVQSAQSDNRPEGMDMAETASTQSNKLPENMTETASLQSNKPPEDMAETDPVKVDNQPKDIVEKNPVEPDNGLNLSKKKIAPESVNVPSQDNKSSNPKVRLPQYQHPPR